MPELEEIDKHELLPMVVPHCVPASPVQARCGCPKTECQQAKHDQS